MTKERKEYPWMTICAECKHFKNLEPGIHGDSNSFSGMFKSSVWYNHLCKASPLPERVNHHGRKIIGGGMPFQFCHWVNKGNCSKFEEIA